MPKWTWKDELLLITLIVLCWAHLGFLGGIAEGAPENNQGTLEIPIKGGVYNVNQIADAIYWAEGGEKASKPYGILSIPCHSQRDCRDICKNTIRNNYRRWIEQGKTQDYIEFLANRYAPVGSPNDPGQLNKNWIKNVSWFLTHPHKLSTGN